MMVYTNCTMLYSLLNPVVGWLVETNSLLQLVHELAKSISRIFAWNLLRIFLVQIWRLQRGAEWPRGIFSIDRNVCKI